MSNDLKYCHAAGTLWSLAKFLHKDLSTAIEMLEDAGITDDYRLSRFQISLEHSGFLATKTFGQEFLGDDFPQQDTVLASGKIKTPTGYVEDAPSAADDKNEGGFY